MSEQWHEDLDPALSHITHPNIEAAVSRRFYTHRVKEGRKVFSMHIGGNIRWAGFSKAGKVCYGSPCYDILSFGVYGEECYAKLTYSKRFYLTITKILGPELR